MEFLISHAWQSTWVSQLGAWRPLWPFCRPWDTCRLTGLCLGLAFFGIVRVSNPNLWITIPMTRIVGKICKNTRGKSLTGARRAAVIFFFDVPGVFAYFANSPSHGDGNPGIFIVNSSNPKQSQFKAEACQGGLLFTVRDSNAF